MRMAHAPLQMPRLWDSVLKASGSQNSEHLSRTDTYLRGVLAAAALAHATSYALEEALVRVAGNQTNGFSSSPSVVSIVSKPSEEATGAPPNGSPSLMN